VLGLVFAPLAVEQATGAHVSFIGTAQAAGGPSGSGSGAMGGQGAAGTGGHSGTDAVTSGEDEEGDGGKGSMQQGGGTHGQGSYKDNMQQGGGSGGPGEDSDAKGPHYGGGGSGDVTHGGKPIWAQEGIPEVELGRLSVARSPSHVLQKALDETLANYTTDMDSLYTLTAEQAAALLKTQYDTVVRIDSPLENLALYQELLADGSTQLPVTPASRNDLAAILLGSASDKTVPITEDTVKAVSIILGVQDNLTASDITEIATKAEDVRAAISEGHGE